MPAPVCSFDAEDFAAPLYYTERARGSRFFKLMPDWALDALQQRPLAFENHARGAHRWRGSVMQPQVGAAVQRCRLHAALSGSPCTLHL